MRARRALEKRVVERRWTRPTGVTPSVRSKARAARGSDARAIRVGPLRRRVRAGAASRDACGSRVVDCAARCDRRRRERLGRPRNDTRRPLLEARSREAHGATVAPRRTLDGEGRPARHDSARRRAAERRADVQRGRALGRRVSLVERRFRFVERQAHRAQFAGYEPTALGKIEVAVVEALARRTWRETIDTPACERREVGVVAREPNQFVIVAVCPGAVTITRRTWTSRVRQTY